MILQFGQTAEMISMSASVSAAQPAAVAACAAIDVAPPVSVMFVGVTLAVFRRHPFAVVHGGNLKKER
jgi:hypothetical protein